MLYSTYSRTDDRAANWEHLGTLYLPFTVMTTDYIHNRQSSISADAGRVVQSSFFTIIPLLSDLCVHTCNAVASHGDNGQLTTLQSCAG